MRPLELGLGAGRSGHKEHCGHNRESVSQMARPIRHTFLPRADYFQNACCLRCYYAVSVAQQAMIEAARTRRPAKSGFHEYTEDHPIIAGRQCRRRGRSDHSRRCRGRRYRARARAARPQDGDIADRRRASRCGNTDKRSVLRQSRSRLVTGCTSKTSRCAISPATIVLPKAQRTTRFCRQSCVRHSKAICGPTEKPARETISAS